LSVVFGSLDTVMLTLFKVVCSGVGFRVVGEPQRLSFVDVRDLVDAIILMAADTRAESFTYYTSHPEAFDVVDLWRALGRAVGHSVRVIPVPRAVLYAAMIASTGASRVLRFRNQLDKKQYDQMVAPAFLCSGKKLERDLGWTPRFGLAAALEHAAASYREAGWLRK
jgi:nucleoside-diphosphate-sugar epimerase